jgi:hypothetical protein
VPGPELIVDVEVSRVKPGFGRLAIADVEDLGGAVFQPSSGPFGARCEQRDNVLIVGDNVVQLGAECSPRKARGPGRRTASLGPGRHGHRPEGSGPESASGCRRRSTECAGRRCRLARTPRTSRAPGLHSDVPIWSLPRPDPCLVRVSQPGVPVVHGPLGALGQRMVCPGTCWLLDSS